MFPFFIEEVFLGDDQINKGSFEDYGIEDGAIFKLW